MKNLTVLVVLTSSLCANVFSATRYVNATNLNPLPPFAGWATAATNIQDAVDAAEDGDQVVVMDGLYRFGSSIGGQSHTNRVAITRPLTVRSVNGPHRTMIEGMPDPSGAQGFGPEAIRCIYVASNAVLSGFTLTNGYTRDGASGGGAFCENSAVISNCVFTANAAWLAGGGCYGGTVFNCYFISNRAVWGGAAGYATMGNCVMAYNFAGEVGGGSIACALRNCTVVYNFAGENGGGVWDGPVYNSIVYYNAPSDYYTYSYGSFDYCCIVPVPSRGTGNTQDEPGFLDAAARNFRLAPNSLCINAAKNSYTPLMTDGDGRNRIVSGTSDMGAYEFDAQSSGYFLAWLHQNALATDGSADTVDSDSDASNNWQEWRAGTNPLNSSSLLSLFSPTLAGPDIVLSWQSVAGRSYFLQRSIGLQDGIQFETIVSGIPALSARTSFTHTNPAAGAVFIYRVGVH